MQNSFINKITPSIRIAIIFLLSLTLFISKSSFLTILLTIIIVMILLLSEKNVNLYIDSIKRNSIWLIFSIFAYIIVYRNIIDSIVFAYKLILVIILIKNFMLNISFSELNSGIYKLLLPFKNLNANLENISFNITLYIYYYSYLRQSGNKVKKSQVLNNKISYSVKHFLMPRLLISTNDINNLQKSLKLKFFNISEEKVNFKSLILLILFISLFVVAFIKEVIL